MLIMTFNNSIVPIGYCIPMLSNTTQLVTLKLNLFDLQLLCPIHFKLMLKQECENVEVFGSF
jgi:hypothetical protein